MTSSEITLEAVASISQIPATDWDACATGHADLGGIESLDTLAPAANGYASKANYSDGEWRILVETTDGREIGRLKFKVTKVASADDSRMLETIER